MWSIPWYLRRSAALVAAIALLAGCSGGSSAPSTVASPPPPIAPVKEHADGTGRTIQPTAPSPEAGPAKSGTAAIVPHDNSIAGANLTGAQGTIAEAGPDGKTTCAGFHPEKLEAGQACTCAENEKGGIAVVCRALGHGEKARPGERETGTPHGG